MRRGIFTLMLGWSLLCFFTLSVVCAEQPTVQPTISIQVREASIPEVIQTVIALSGANIVLEGGITGSITLKHDNIPVDRVLEYICQAKGNLYWWRNQDGTYFVATHPQPMPNAEARVMPGVPAAKEAARIWRMYTLKFAAPQFLSYLFGGSNDPGPEIYQYSASDITELGSLSRQPGKKSGGSGFLGELQGMGGGGGGFGGSGGGGFGGGGGGGGTILSLSSLSPFAISLVFLLCASDETGGVQLLLPILQPLTEFSIVWV